MVAIEDRLQTFDNKNQITKQILFLSIFVANIADRFLFFFKENSVAHCYRFARIHVITIFVGCVDSMYGEGCDLPCGMCADSGSCDQVTGVCNTGCQAGFQGEMCTEGNINSVNCWCQ